MPKERFNAQEAMGYWREHFGRRAPVDFDRDPDALNNVCYPGVPLWLNQYYARFQERVFRKLLARIPVPASDPRKSALDVGCGGGRWCRVLAAHGYDPTGVDLQEDLILRNRERYPKMKFICGSMQGFSSQTVFDLVTSVTVIQHNPPDAQDDMIRTMRRILPTGGHVLALENVRDQDVHVFSSSVDGWIRRFERAGFACKAVQRYDYSPLLRGERALVGGIKG
ncbi:MAG: class I SAM-dependent methyltransferase, partial [Polyangiaceae bacterium]